nr:M20/M25/M40 family metallo-hydrolase [Pseudooceanicola sp. HF7]
MSRHDGVLPAQESGWLCDPLLLRRDGERLIGRGACDMRGFVAAVLAAGPELAAMRLKAALRLMASCRRGGTSRKPGCAPGPA